MDVLEGKGRIAVVISPLVIMPDCFPFPLRKKVLWCFWVNMWYLFVNTDFGAILFMLINFSLI